MKCYIHSNLLSPYNLGPSLGDGATDWLNQQLAVNGFEGMILKLLDAFLSQQTPDQNFETYDPNVIRWLNFYEGEDVDVVLQRLSPTGKAFRDDQILTRHYDPLIAFREFGLFRERLAMPDTIIPGRGCLPGETRRRRLAALPLMFDSPKQREACESMFVALFGPDMPTVAIKDARARTVDWYWKNRDRLHFDPKVGRLTVGSAVLREQEIYSSSPLLQTHENAQGICSLGVFERTEVNKGHQSTRTSDFDQ